MNIFTEEFTYSIGEQELSIKPLKLTSRIEVSTDLLKSIILNRVSALVGRASSGKTYLLEDLLKRSGLLKQSITVYLTPETDVNQLCGSYVFDNSQ